MDVAVTAKSSKTSNARKEIQVYAKLTSISILTSRNYRQVYLYVIESQSALV